MKREYRTIKTRTGNREIAVYPVPRSRGQLAIHRAQSKNPSAVNKSYVITHLPSSRTIATGIGTLKYAEHRARHIVDLIEAASDVWPDVWVAFDTEEPRLTLPKAFGTAFTRALRGHTGSAIYRQGVIETFLSELKAGKSGEKSS